MMDSLVEQCKQLQRVSASQLRGIADMLREEQRKMNIAKVSFNSAGVVAAGLSIAGVVLAPFTAGTSLGLTIAGGGIGVAAGVGDLSTYIAEITIIGQRVDEVQGILDQLAEKTEALLEKLRPQLNSFGISWDEVMTFLFKKGGSIAFGGKNIYDNIKNALEVAKATTHAQKIAISLGGGERVANAVTTGMRTARSNPRIAGGVAGVRALNTTAKVAKVAGVVGSVVGIGFNIAAIVDNSIKINGNVSELADAIERIADALKSNY